MRNFEFQICFYTAHKYIFLQFIQFKTKEDLRRITSHETNSKVKQIWEKVLRIQFIVNVIQTLLRLTFCLELFQ